MKNENIITGIDIGTTKIVVIIAEKNGDIINILGIGKSSSKGLQKGIVINIDETVKSIETAILKAEKDSKTTIDSAYVGITGENIKGINCSGAITISNSDYLNPAGDIIEKDDVLKVLDHSQAINLSPDRKILHVLSQNFKVDDKSGIKNPVGLSGHRLESKVHLVTIARNIEQDLITCINKCNIEIDGFILEPLASSYSVLDNNERNLGTVLIDIGGGTSDIIIYNDNSILHTGAIPIGGESLTKDIAYGIQTSLEQAETLKRDYGICKSSLANEEESIKIMGTNGRPDTNISQKELSKIIEARMHEIFHLCKNEINKSELKSKFTFGIVLTGGGSKMKNIVDLAQEIFEMPVKIGIPDSVNGKPEVLNNPRFSTSIGIVKYAIENENSIQGDIDNYHTKSFFDIIKIKLNKIKQTLLNK